MTTAEDLRVAMALIEDESRNVQDRGAAMTAPREYPILFSAPMVRAILDGTKTQTRRLPTSMWANVAMRVEVGEPTRLWVRETWAEIGSCDPGLLIYRASYPGCVPAQYENIQPDTDVRWRTSIHMPCWASRITLDVLTVRRERLQEISEEDVRAEGVIFGPAERHGGHDPRWILGCCRDCRGWSPRTERRNRFCPYRRWKGEKTLDLGQGCSTSFKLRTTPPDPARFQFKFYWDWRLHRKPGTRWADNPEVYVIEFARAQR